MIKLLKQYITEKKRANDLKERELKLLYDPVFFGNREQRITVHIPQLNNVEVKSPNTSNPNWTISTWDTHTKLES